MRLAPKHESPRSAGPWNLFRIVCPLLLVGLFVGCAPTQKIEKAPDPTRFLFVTPDSGATLESMARDHLGDAKLAWLIAEFNGIDKAVAGEQIIVPLQPFRPGGLTAKGYQLVPVLAYHHFNKSRSRKKMVVSAKNFDAQMRYLKQRGYQVINLEEFADFLEFGQIPKKSVIITLDDGWQSAYSIAYPIIKKYGFSAILYIPTNSIREKGGRLLSWNQIRTMVKDNTVDIQAHTKSHRDLTKIKSRETFAAYIKSIRNEIAGAKHIISNKLGQEATSLSYPFGATNSLVGELARIEKYTTGFTVKRNGNPFFQNNFELNRSMIYGSFDQKKFAKNLVTFHSDSIDLSQPIDVVGSPSELNYRSPQQYEDKKQWRTASMAWRMHRDWLIAEIEKQPSEVDSKQAQQRGEALERIKQADRKIMEMNTKLEAIASDLYRSAMARSEETSRRRLLLKTLLHDPGQTEALISLKGSAEKDRLISYSVKSGDSLRKIAAAVYRDKRKSILIPIFNTQVRGNSDLQPGLQLKLPKVPKRIAKAGIAKGNGGGPCGLPNSAKSPAERSAEYYARAVRQFDQNRVAQANSSLKTALCLDPQNSEAKEMQGLLEGL